MAYRLNPFTGKFDESKVDKTPIGDADTYFRFVPPDTLQLLVNGSVAQEWVVLPSDGQPIGLLLALTKA